MSDALVERLAGVLGVVLATHCGHCLRPMASEADWENTEEGERPDLCWEDPANCPLGADVEPQQFYARALLPVVEQEIAAARAEAWDEGHRVGWEHHQDGNYGTDWWDDDTPNPYRIARTAAQTPATSTEEER